MKLLQFKINHIDTDLYLRRGGFYYRFYNNMVNLFICNGKIKKNAEEYTGLS